MPRVRSWSVSVTVQRTSSAGKGRRLAGRRVSEQEEALFEGPNGRPGCWGEVLRVLGKKLWDRAENSRSVSWSLGSGHSASLRRGSGSQVSSSAVRPCAFWLVCPRGAKSVPQTPPSLSGTEGKG